MSTRRRTLGVFSSPTPKGPNGERLCRNCHGPMPQDKRKHNCSPKCVEEWRLKTSPHLMRHAVFLRDRGVCAGCGRDTVQEYRDKYRFRETHTFHHAVGDWEADHIVAVIEGGGECGLDGFRTLCLDCHHKETAELARRRAKQRREEGRMNSTQEELFG